MAGNNSTRPRSRRTPRANQVTALKASIRQLRIQVNPEIKPRPAKAQPPPSANAGEKWHPRTVAIPFNIAAGGTALTLGQIVTNLSPNASNVPFRVKAVKIWNITPGGFITVSLNIAEFTVADTSESTPIIFTDYGSTSHLAGIHYDIPDTLTINRAVTLSNASVFANVNGGSNIASTSSGVCHVHLSFLF